MQNYNKKLQELNPIFTDDVLEILWKWIEEKQEIKTSKQISDLGKNQEFIKLIENINHSTVYTKLQP